MDEMLGFDYFDDDEKPESSDVEKMLGYEDPGFAPDLYKKLTSSEDFSDSESGESDDDVGDMDAEHDNTGNADDVDSTDGH